MLDIWKTVVVVFVLSLWIRLQAQEAMLAQSQTCVQELTTELRNRCLELRDMNHRIQDEEKLIQVRAGLDQYILY